MNNRISNGRIRGMWGICGLEIIIDKIFGPALIGSWTIHDGRGEKTLWTLSKARKVHDCAVHYPDHAGIGLIAPGDECYRPVTNRGFRMKRICYDCMKEALDSLAAK